MIFFYHGNTGCVNYGHFNLIESSLQNKNGYFCTKCYHIISFVSRHVLHKMSRSSLSTAWWSWRTFCPSRAGDTAAASHQPSPQTFLCGLGSEILIWFKVTLSALKWKWHSQRDRIELRLGKEIPLPSHKSDLVEIRLSTNCFQLCLMSRKIKHTKIKAFFSLVSTEPSKVSHPTLNFVWTHESLSNLGCVIPDEARKCPTWPPRLPDQTRWAGWGAAPGC